MFLTESAPFNEVLTMDYKPLILFGITLLLTFLFARWFDRFFKKFVLDSSRVLENDPTNYQFLRHSVIALIYIIGTMLAINMVPSLRTLSTSLLAGAGILAVAIGFASQKAFSNIISGMFLIIFKPFRVNEFISIGNDIQGTVEDITLRHTVVKNLENKRIIIPNSYVSDAVVVNSSTIDKKICRPFFVGIAYDADLDKAMQAVMDEAQKHPLVIDNRSALDIANNLPIVNCRIVELGDSAITLKAWVWTKDTADALEVNCDLNKAIVERFRKENISIPFPHQEIIIK